MPVKKKPIRKAVKKLYAHHPESESIMEIDSRQELESLITMNPQIEEITKKEFLELRELYKQSSDPAPKNDTFQVSWVTTKDVSNWEDNPRFNDEAAEKLAQIIAENGFRSPIVAWDKNNIIYKGNTTYKAALILEKKGVFVGKGNKKKKVTLESLTGGKIPVVFHHFESEIAAHAYAIADNKASELADWDEDLLVEMMKTPQFKKLNRNVGFSDQELKMLEFYPPDEDTKEKAKKAGTELTFKIVLEAGQDDYEELLEAIKELLADGFKKVKIK